MSEAPDKRTIGEELFLVHLSRYSAPDESDFDVNLHARTPSMTIGEELWRIHCKRSAGLDEGEEDEGDAKLDDKREEESSQGDRDEEEGSPSRAKKAKPDTQTAVEEDKATSSASTEGTTPLSTPKKVLSLRDRNASVV